MSLASTSAACWTSRSTMSEWPSWEATWRGVLSTFVRASLLIPALRRTSAVSRWPNWAAKCSGEVPNCKTQRQGFSITESKHKVNSLQVIHFRNSNQITLLSLLAISVHDYLNFKDPVTFQRNYVIHRLNILIVKSFYDHVKYPVCCEWSTIRHKCTDVIRLSPLGGLQEPLSQINQWHLGVVLPWLWEDNNVLLFGRL